MTNNSHINGEAKQIVKDFAEAFSIQSKLANRTWIVLLTLIVFSMQTGAIVDGVRIKALPFGFGKIEAADLDTLIYFIISFTTISFCALFSQALRIYDAAHARIDDLPDKEGQRRFFDILTNPTLWRVGPLTIKGNAASNAVTKILFKAYYYILRGSAAIIMLGIPLYGVISSGLLLAKSPSTPIFVMIAGAVIFVLVITSIFIVSKSQYNQIMVTAGCGFANNSIGK